MKEKPFSKYHISINVVMMLWTIIIVLPFLLLFLSSITDETALVANGYSFFPKKFSLASYSYIIKSGGVILRAYGVSIVVTLVGTLLNVLLSALMAYPLSIKNLPGRKFMMFFVFFTMLFNGGIVPSYIMWTGTFHVKDTIFAQLLPNFLLSAWNVMMIRTYFTSSIPDGLYEAAEIDGASQFTIFWKIVLPLGKPILVTMGTFAGLAYWNDWTNGLYYIVKRTDLFNVQNLLNQMVQNIQYIAQSSDANVGSAAANIPATGIQMAIAFVAILPIMLIDLCVKYAQDGDYYKSYYAQAEASTKLYATKSILKSAKYAIATADSKDSDSYPGLDWLFSTERKAGDIYQTSTSVVYVLSPVALPEASSVNVRHILVSPITDSSSNTQAVDATAEQWATALETANKVVSEYNSGDKTEDSFAALVSEYSSDTGSTSKGGLYENVVPGQMVDSFEAWSLDSSRKAGDIGIVQTQYGYHIMYFVGTTGTPIWEENAKSALTSEDSSSAADQLEKAYTAKMNWFGKCYIEIDTDIDR